MTNPHKPSRPRRALTSLRRMSAEIADGRDAQRTQVRARLLRMILDNEEVRRNDQRPSAS